MKNKDIRKEGDNFFKNFFVRSSNFCEKRFPFLNGGPELSSEFLESFRINELGTSAESVVVFSRVCGLILVTSFFLASLLFQNWFLALAGVGLSLACMHFVTEYPKEVARKRVQQGLENAPQALTNLVVSLKQNPNLEEAFGFASRLGTGLFAKDLRRVLNKVLKGESPSIHDELPKLAYKWGERSEGLKRALYYVSESFNESREPQRLEMLDKALGVMIDDSVQRTREFNSKLFTPVLVLFSFGTVLPLIIVSLMPLTSFFGSTGLLSKVVVLLLLSLSGVYFYSLKILRDRPPVFSVINVPRGEGMPAPGFMRVRLGGNVFDVRILPYVLGVFLLVGFPGWVYLLSSLPFMGLTNNLFSFLVNRVNTLSIVWGAGLGFGLWAHGTSSFKKGLRDKAKELEHEVIDAFYQVSNRLAENRSPESAVKFVSETMRGTVAGELFAKASRKISLHKTSLKKAFKELGGGVHSDRARSLITIFVNSVEHGNKKSSEVLFTSADFFSKLNDVSKELKNMLQKNLSMMKSTALLFSPMICAMIVGLQKIILNTVSSAQQTMSASGYEFISIPFFQFSPINLGMLQLILGLYSLGLSVVLTSFVSRITWGDDEIMVKQDVGNASIISVFVFTLSLLIINFLL